MQQIGSDQAITGGGGAACQPQTRASIGYTAWAYYSANNQFTQTSQAQGGVQYDASGDIVGDGSNLYLYNADGQICAVRNMTGWTEYIYDAEGRRVAEGSISSWRYDTATNGFTVTANYVRDQVGHQLGVRCGKVPGQDCGACSGACLNSNFLLPPASSSGSPFI